MKKFLSMVLAMVMTLSLVTVSAGAKEFPDSDELTGDSDGVYAEAVNVLSEMGIIDGDTDGNFKPKGTLTRGAASKIIACMMLGKTTAESLGTAAAPFKDVPVGSTFAGYIAYCVEQGIIDGYADGTFRPSGALTGYAFQKMLLTALGYDSKIEGYANNPNWRVNVAGRAQQEGILTGLDLSSYSAAEAATREQACLMALNTIKTPLVEYESKGSSITVNGATVSQAASSAKYVTTVDKNRATAISSKRYQTTATGSADAYFVEFGEQYQTDLRRTYTTDDFGRPAYTWTWQKDEIDTYVDYSLLLGEYNTGVSGRALRELISQSTIDQVLEDRGYAYYVDGVLIGENTEAYAKKIDNKDMIYINPKTDLIRGNEEDAGMTKNGVLTQVFLNRDTADGDWELTITSIDTWLAKANADYNSSAEELSLTAYTAKSGSDKTVTKNLKVDVEDVPAIEGVKKDDFILIQRSGKDSDGTNVTEPNLRVVNISDVEILSDQTITQFSKGDDNERAIDKLTTGGTQYNFSQKCFYDAEALDEYNHSLLTNMTYDVYLDTHGYVIGVTVHEGNRNYVFITAYDLPSSSILNRSATATAIFLDGSMQDITVNAKDTNTNIENYNRRERANSSDTSYFADNDWKVQGQAQHNRWYTYTVNTAGVYTLKPADRMLIDATNFDTAGNATLNSANLSLRAIANYGTPKTAGGTTRAYGNDDSVYITVTANDSVTSGNTVTIDDVQGLYTGVQNVKLELKKTTPSIFNDQKVFALYDSDNYVIAAIVLGEAQGSISNYAYIYSRTTSEKYEDGYYYWTFDGIQNGEFKTFTARSKFSDTMDVVDANQYHMMQLLFDGDYVSRVNPIPASKFYINNTVNMGQPYPTTSTGKKVEEEVDVYDVGHTTANNVSYSSNYTFMENCGAAQDGYGNMPQMGRLDGTIYLSGNTLYVDPINSTNKDTGLAIRNNTKAVLIQHKNGKRTHTEHTTVQDAIDSMRDARDDLNDMQFKGRIVAPLRDGVAQWVLIISDTIFKTGDRGGATSGSGSTVVRPSGNITINGPQSTSTTANFTGRGTLTADSVSVTLDSNHDLRISFTKSASDAYSSGTAEITVNNRVITVPLTKNAAGQLEGRTSGEAINITDSISVDITRAVATSTTDDTNVPSGNIVSKPSTVESISVQKGSVISAEDVKVEIPSTGTNANKVIVTVPTGNLPTGTKVGDTFELTVEDENGNKETVSATVTASGLSFTSTRSFASAKNVKLSVAKKTETPLPTGQVQVKGKDDATATFVEDTLIITMPYEANGDEAPTYKIAVSVNGTDITSTLTAGAAQATADGKWQVSYTGSALKASNASNTIVTISNFVDSPSKAANDVVKAAALATGDGSDAVKKELNDLAEAQSGSVAYSTGVTVPNAQYNETSKAYEIKLTGNHYAGSNYPNALSNTAGYKETANAIVVPVNFTVPAGAEKLVLARDAAPKKAWTYGEEVNVTTANPETGDYMLNRTLTANEKTNGFDFVAFVRGATDPGNAINNPTANKAVMTFHATWVDKDGKALADTITFVIDGSNVTIGDQEDAFKAAAKAAATDVSGDLTKAATADQTTLANVPVMKDANITVGAAVGSSIPLTVTGTHVADSTKTFAGSPLGYPADSTADKCLVVPIMIKIPEGATAYTLVNKADSPKTYTLSSDAKEAGYDVLCVLVELGANATAPTSVKEIEVQWSDGTNNADIVRYVIDCSGVTVTKP